MVALFLDDNKTNDDDDDKKNGKKKKNVYINNNNFSRVLCHFLHFLLPSLHYYDMKLPNFTSPLYGVGEHNTKCVAFFF